MIEPHSEPAHVLIQSAHVASCSAPTVSVPFPLPPPAGLALPLVVLDVFLSSLPPPQAAATSVMAATRATAVAHRFDRFTADLPGCQYLARPARAPVLSNPEAEQDGREREHH